MLDRVQPSPNQDRGAVGVWKRVLNPNRLSRLDAALVTDRQESPLKIVVFGLGLLLVIVILRSAWISEDAFISFRTIDNFVSGNGLRWNVLDRVQTYTNPLWVLLITPFYALTGEVVVTVTALSILVTLAAVICLLNTLTFSHAAAIAGLAALVSSKSFIDYSTSGLENPLLFLLGIGFVSVLLRSQASLNALTALTALASLAATTRMDTVLLFAPGLVYFLYLVLATQRVSAWTFLWRMTLASSPFWGWTMFALIYYGFLFPNTYYAKLYTGIPDQEMLAQGASYFLNSLSWDAVTLPLIGASVALCFAKRDPRSISVAVGCLLYLAYTLKVGGDFMSGRFFAVPFAMMVPFVLRWPWKDTTFYALAALFIVAGLTNWKPTLLYNERFAVDMVWDVKSPTGYPVWDHRGIADERAFTYQATGLMPAFSRQFRVPPHALSAQGLAAREAGERFIVVGNIGLYGFYAGPEVHIIDDYALGDPLISKLPLARIEDWRIGHYRREVPAGYIDSLRTGENRIEDPLIASLYGPIKTITQDNIWSWSRFAEIWKFNLGYYEPVIDELIDR